MEKIRKIKDPGSAITHFIGMLLALSAATPLLLKASREQGFVHVISLAIFIASMILLYTASTVYHTFNLSEKVNCILKKCDHMMIFILIAGTYTPVCLIVLGGQTGFLMLCLIWGMAVAGICLKAFWVYCPKWVSSVIYIAMGWTCILAISKIFSTLPTAAFIWLVAGGVIYTIGGVIYALKFKIFNNKHKYFGSHEIFHLFCIGGSFCHFVFMYQYIATMPLH